jgi:hypothetical protein
LYSIKIILATVNRSKAIVKLLLDKNANVDYQDKNKMTALHLGRILTPEKINIDK